MKSLAIALSLMLVSPSAMAAGDSSSRALYEFLASKGLEAWRNDFGGYIRMLSFSCNSNYLKDIKVLMHDCWYTIEKNRCESDDIIHVNDQIVAASLYQAMTKMGLPIIALNDSAEKWSQIDADGLSCMLSIDRTKEPPRNSYECSAMKKLKN